MTDRILETNNLKAYYSTGLDGKQYIRAVDDIAIFIKKEEAFGIAGESGCGKSTLIRVLYGFVDPPLKVFEGNVCYYTNNGERQEILSLGRDVLSRMRWEFFSYIPQASMSVLNPTMRIRDQFLQIIKAHTKNFHRKETMELVTKSVQQLGLPIEVLGSFPHQLSGGMRQRVVLAMATILKPKIMFADEPTIALDVVVQRGVIQLLKRVQKDLKNTLVLVSHDMGVQAQIADRMAIMYAGNIVEVGPTDRIFKSPKHPYTQFLIRSLPRIGDKSEKIGAGGFPPSLLNPPPGCRFHPRCQFKKDACDKIMPKLVEVEPEHYVACNIE